MAHTQKNLPHHSKYIFCKARSSWGYHPASVSWGLGLQGCTIMSVLSCGFFELTSLFYVFRAVVVSLLEGLRTDFQCVWLVSWLVGLEEFYKCSLLQTETSFVAQAGLKTFSSPSVSVSWVLGYRHAPPHSADFPFLHRLHLLDKTSQAVVAHTFNSSTWEAEAGRSLEFETAWSTELVPRQLELLHGETLSRKTKTKIRNKINNKFQPSLHTIHEARVNRHIATENFE